MTQWTEQLDQQVKAPARSQSWPGKPEHDPIEPSQELGREWLKGLEDEDEHK